MPFTRKPLRHLAGAILLLALLTVSAAWLAVRGSLPQLSGEITAPLDSALTIARDAAGVPTLHAETRTDVAWGLGYLHAQERFFQMDLLRRTGAGELAALFGAPALPADHAHRVHRFRARAQAQVARLPPEQRQLLQRYVDGVNAGLNALKVRPFEYLLLRQTPQAWQPEDTLLVVCAMYFDLQGHQANHDRFISGLQALLPPDWFAFINPPGGAFDAPLAGDAYPTPLMPTSRLSLPAAPAEQDNTLQSSLSAAFPEAAGSNSWAVSGQLTADGHALLANDMHLGLRLPNIWYRAVWQIAGGNMLSGVTLPGAPLIVIGSNSQVAWGFTNSYVDSVDLLRLQAGDDADHFRLNGQQQAYTQYQERLEVSGEAVQTLNVRETPWGPVVGEDATGQPLVLSWTAYADAGLNMNLIQMESVTRVEQALAAAPGWGVPNQNLLVADQAGQIGWTITGPLPKRAQYQAGIINTPWQGSGSTPRPQVLNPAGQRLWTANNRVMTQADHEHIGGSGYALGARAGQIREGLNALQRADEAGLLAIALDERALFLERWHQQLRRELNPAQLKRSPELQTLLDALQDWDGRASADSRAYLAVRQFRLLFHAHTLGHWYAAVQAQDPEAGFTRIHDEYALWALLTQKPAQVQLAEDNHWEDLLNRVLLATLHNLTPADGQAVPTLTTWGTANTLDMAHPFARILPVLRPWLALPLAPQSGDMFMPKVSGTVFGASERMIVAPGKEAKGIFQMPGGQAGHPLSPYWGAGHEDWLQGRPAAYLPGKTEWVLQVRPAPER